MKYDIEYINFLLQFHCERDYFECHEILEEFWKKNPVNHRNDYLVGLIQMSVGLYHQRRGNYAGALKMITNSIHILHKEKIIFPKLGLDYDKLLKALEKRKLEIMNHQAYYSFDLPIVDKSLLEHCKTLAKESQRNWGETSDLSNEYILHKHMKRDRTEVIQEREKQLLQRQANRK
ncbi:DUF309 domain-containing protein [Metabacillus malikii]|uniref:Metal-dependent hydrolase n=1 Tax=Metabacillus malikii TaxID=1504265 RepID=A0ABT9ZKT0_9BACI|nr:DUF309 domain-containing protein [Metabacillus malikii]MDQ0232906.1 putative metal-dependent hydrolase [Metabacillus malikii]